MRARGTAPSETFKPDQIARTGDAERGSRDQPLEVVHVLQRLAQLRAIDAVKRQLLDRVEAVANRFQRDQRTQQPPAQEAAAHRRDREIELVEQRAGAAALGALDDLEVLQRDRIDQQVVGLLAQVHAGHVREIGLLRVAQIADEGAAGLRRGRTRSRGRSLRDRACGAAR